MRKPVDLDIEWREHSILMQAVTYYEGRIKLRDGNSYAITRAITDEWMAFEMADGVHVKTYVESRLTYELADFYWRWEMHYGGTC